MTNVEAIRKSQSSRVSPGGRLNRHACIPSVPHEQKESKSAKRWKLARANSQISSLELSLSLEEEMILKVSETLRSFPIESANSHL